MYKIRDLQFEDRYFANGSLFKTKKEICEHLIDYHSIDCNMRQEKELLDKGKIEKCIKLLEDFEWKIEEV